MINTRGCKKITLTKEYESNSNVWNKMYKSANKYKGGYMIHPDHLFGIVVSTSDCHPKGPGFDSRLYPRNLSGSIGSGTGSTQPREDNWVVTWMRSSEIWLRKLKLRLRDKRFANHKAHCTVNWQQPLQLVLALRGCSATDLINLINYLHSLSSECSLKGRSSTASAGIQCAVLSKASLPLQNQEPRLQVY